MIFEENLRFIQENLTVFTRKCDNFCMVFKGTFDDLHFPVKLVKFSCTNRQIFFKNL